MTTALLEGIVLGVHLLTYHPGPANLQDVNPGVYMRHVDSGVQVGVYDNSYGRTSVYLAKTFEAPTQIFGATLGIAVGGVTGYRPKSSHSKVQVLLTPTIEHSGWRVTYLPKPPKYGKTSSFHLSWESRF